MRRECHTGDLLASLCGARGILQPSSRGHHETWPDGSLDDIEPPDLIRRREFDRDPETVVVSEVTVLSLRRIVVRRSLNFVGEHLHRQ